MKSDYEWHYNKCLKVWRSALFLAWWSVDCKPPIYSVCFTTTTTPPFYPALPEVLSSLLTITSETTVATSTMLGVGAPLRAARAVTVARQPLVVTLVLQGKFRDDFGLHNVDIILAETVARATSMWQRRSINPHLSSNASKNWIREVFKKKKKKKCGIFHILTGGGGKIGWFSTFIFFFFLASKWSETSRNAKKIFPLVRGGEGGWGGFGLL